MTGMRHHFDRALEIFPARFEAVSHAGQEFALPRVHAPGIREPSLTVHLGSNPTSLSDPGTRKGPGLNSDEPRSPGSSTMNAPSQVDIESAIDSASVALVTELLQEYADSIGFPLDFQDFDREMRTLPGEYAIPSGVLLLARVNGVAAGCVGLRPLDPTTCEMKRLFVRPGARGFGVGRKLAHRVVEEARTRGYLRMRLDTVPSMTTALVLYRSMGFVEIPPYRFNPIPGTLYLELAL